MLLHKKCFLQPSRLVWPFEPLDLWITLLPTPAYSSPLDSNRLHSTPLNSTRLGRYPCPCPHFMEEGHTQKKQNGTAASTKAAPSQRRGRTKAPPTKSKGRAAPAKGGGGEIQHQPHLFLGTERAFQRGTSFEIDVDTQLRFIRFDLAHVLL